MSIIAIGYQPPKAVEVESVANAAVPRAVSIGGSDIAQPSVDQLIATSVAAGIAERAELPIATNVANLSLSLAAESQIARADNNVISKPQIIQPSADSREMRSYTTVAGDNVDKLAAQFGISKETIKWANNLTSDTLEAGRVLQIPPIDGVVYTVRDGDSIASIAERYKVDERRLVAYNDLEFGGLDAGKKIILPDGDMPSTERPGYVAPRPVIQSIVNYGGGFGGNSWYIKTGTSGAGSRYYAYGNCTAYAFDRRQELGLPVGIGWGNASTWAYYAARQDYLVNNTPSVGAIMQNGGGYGHVAIVEEVMPNGDVRISEMNAYVPGGGFNIVSGRIIPASNARAYAYIH